MRRWLVALVVLGMVFGATPRPAYGATGPDLILSATQSVSLAAVGDTVAYVFAVTNQGDTAAANVVVGECDSRDVCVSLPVTTSLAAGARQFVGINIAMPRPGVFSVSGTASTTTAETNTSNNSAFVRTTVAFTVNATDDAVDTAGCDARHCSLREAIADAGNFEGPRFVFFHIPGTAPFTIAPIETPLPAVTDGITLDGTTQPGFAGLPLIFLDGSNLPLGSNGLTVSGALNTVRGLAIGNFTGSAVVLSGGSNTLAGSFIGTDATGTVARPNGGSTLNGAVHVTGNSNLVGGPNAADRNVVSGNAAQGIDVNGGTGNTVQNDLVGTTRDGAGRLGNKINGILVESAPSTTVTGNVSRYNMHGLNFASDFDTFTGNVFSSNVATGITGSGSGNYFSFDTVTGNGSDGVMLGYPASTTQRNVIEDSIITGNGGDGIFLRGPSGLGNEGEVTDTISIRRGSISNNSLKGIDLAFGANEGLLPPTVTRIEGNTSQLLVEGLHSAGFATIDLYADGADEGAQYLGSTRANADGFWQMASWNETVDLAALWRGLASGRLFIHPTQTRSVSESGETSEFQLVTPAPTGVVSGIARCTFNNGGTLSTFVMANARVDVYSGTALLSPPSPATADANGAFSIAGLAANAQYRFVFTGPITYNIGESFFTATVSCAVNGSTDGAGGLSLGDPSTIRNLRNHTFLTAYDLAADPLHIVTKDAFGALVLNDRLFKKGQSNWFKIPIKPGQRVVANLRDLPADYSLAMYKDLLALLAATRTTTLADVSRLTAAMSPDELSPDELSPDELSPDELSPDELSPDELSPDELSPDELSPDELSPDELSPDELSPDELSPDELSPDELSADGYSSVQVRGLLGVSAHAGLSPELIARHSWDNTGSFFFRVRAAASPGATVDADRDFTISARAIDSDCIGVPLTKTAPTATGTPGVRTLFVTHTGRLPGLRDPLTKGLTAAGTDYLARVSSFAATLPNAAVVDLFGDAGINANYAVWDGARTCAAAANVVADSIHDLIASYRGASSSTLTYVVILGGNLAIPAHLVPDQAGLGNERSFSPPVLDDSASKASLATGYFASYDFYASFAPISRYDHDLYLPDRGVSVGVLVESAADILKALDAYTATSGGVSPTNALVTGYDFLSYVAQDGQSQLAASGVNTSSLVEPPGLGPTNVAAWSADDLRARLFGTQRYGVIDWNAHFSANRMLAADSTTRLLATEIANVTDGRFRGTFVLASGCHIGYNIQDPDAITAVTQPISFPEALLGQGATLIGSTGYGYHDTFTPKYTGRLVSLVLTELRYDSGPIATGAALSNAKRDYVQELAALRGIDEKALSELTLYGLPFFSVDLPAGRLVRPSAGGVTPTPSNTSAGLATFDLTPTYTLTRHDATVPISTGGSATVSYLDANGDVSTTPGQPVLPRVVTDVRAAGYAARGAVLVSADYTDLSPFRPRVDVATTEVRGVQREYVTSVRAPVLPFALNSFDHPSLVALPMQYLSAQGPAGLLGTGTARRFDAETVRITYSSLTGAAADAGAPVLYDVSLTQDATKVHVDVTAGSLSSVGIDGILATYTALPGASTLYGHFRSISLIAGAPGGGAGPGFFAHYTGDIETAGTGAAPSDVRLLIQAVGGNGLVSYRTGQGNLLGIASETATATSPKIATSLALTAPATATATYGTSINVSARLTDPSGAPLSGKTVSFKLEGAREKATTDATGTATASLGVAVYPSPAPYQIEASFAEDAADLGSGASQDVLVVKGDSSFALATAPSTQYSDQAVVATLRSGAQLLDGRPVIIRLPDGRAVGLLTDGFGRVIFDTLDFGGVAAGVYNASLTFGGDDGHQSAIAQIPVTVTPENATIALGLPPQPLGTVTLGARVTQEADRSAGDLARAMLTFTLTSDTGAITRVTVPVSATGVATASLTLGAGVYAVDASLDGKFFAASASSLLAVFDTNTFAAGGGSVDTTATSLGLGSGKRATFAFNVKFKDSSSVPTGTTRVKIRPKEDRDEHEGWDDHLGRIDLRVTSYDWLVIDTITGGRRATFEGAGTLNGTAGWRFRVIAQDLAKDDDSKSTVRDTFEIRIWDANGSFDTPTYSVSGPIASGQIKIH